MGLSAWITIIGFAISSSVDNFGVGVSYGVSKIRIGNVANLIISAIAFLFSILGIVAGKYLMKILPGVMSNIIAAVFLFIISIRIILLTLSAKRDAASGKNTRRKAKSSITDKYIGTPEQADLDQSGEIGLFEALVLGIAVSMNALANGLGAGLLGLSAIAIALSAAVFSYLAIWGGFKLGHKVAGLKIGSWSLGQFSTAISGIILLIIAVHVLWSH